MKKPVKIILRIVIGLFVFCSLVILFFFIFFPEKKIIALIETQSESSGMPVRIGSLAWKFPARMEAGRIEVRGLEWQTRDSEPFFRLNRLSVKCKILPLFRRRLEISEVRIDEPKVSLDSSFFKLKPKPKSEKPPAKLQSLPLSIRLLDFSLDRFRLRMKLPSGQGGSEMIVDGLNMDVSGVRVPRKWIDSPDGVRGSVRLFTERAALSIRSAGTEFLLAPDLNIEFKWLKEREWSLDAKAGVSPVQSKDLPGILFNAAIEGKGYADSVRIRDAMLSCGSEVLVRFTGGASRTRDDILFRVRALGTAASLKSIRETAERFLPDTLVRMLDPLEVIGSWSALEGELQGRRSGFQFRFTSAIRNAFMQSRLPPLSIQNGNATVLLAGKWKPSGFEDGGVTGRANLGQIILSVDDTTSFSIRNFSADLNVETDGQFLPKKGKLTGSIADLLKGRTDFAFSLSAGSGKTFHPETALLSGEVRMDSLDVSALPNVQKGIGGKLSGILRLKANGARNIQVYAEMKTAGIRYDLQKKAEITPGVSIRADAFCRALKDFEVFIIDSVLVRSSDDLFSARMSGQLRPKESSFDFSVDRAVLHNSPIALFLPKSLPGEMKGINFSGDEVLKLRVRGSGSGKNLRISTEGKLAVEKAGVALPEQAIGVENIDGQLSVSGTLDKLEGSASFGIANVFLNQVRSAPLRESQIRFDLTTMLPDSVRIENGVLEIPSLLTGGRFRFEMGQMSKAPRMALSAEAALRSPGLLEVMRGLTLSGNALCKLKLESLNAARQQFRISGLVESDSMGVFQQMPISRQGTAVQAARLEVKNVFCSVPFRLDVDLLEKRILNPNSSASPYRAEYEAGRERLRHTGSGPENIRIEKVSVLEYSIDHILVDLIFQGGRIDVPWFSANLLGGNVGGSLQIDLKTGLPQDLAYSIRAQASRINASQLRGLGIQTGEATELDATLSFVGKGVDVNHLDLEGSFHITQIGPQFASTLLEQMDPNGNDRSIRLTRRLLNTGWKPKLLSFELRHGYVYPSLVLDQPWFSPLRIPDKVEYGRLPIEFFMKQRSVFEAAMKKNADSK